MTAQKDLFGSDVDASSAPMPTPVARGPQLTPQQQALNRDMVFFLHGRLQRKGWTRPQKRIMKEILCALAQPFIPEGDPEMLALHDQHSEDSFADQQKAALAEAGAMMEDVLGVSLDGKDGFESVGFAWSSSCLGARPSVPQRCPGT